MIHSSVLPPLSLVLIAALLLAGGAPGLAAVEQGVCPKCGAPVDPDAAFCGSCGAKLERAAAPAPAARTDHLSAVVQVVAIHDTELTSTLASLAYEANIRVDSILGSAFAVAPGEFVTDSGLLVGARDVALRATGGVSVPARLVGSDAMIGVALLKADLPDVSPLVLRRDTPVRAGESVRAVGYPSSHQSTGEPVVSTGIVSGLHRGAAGIHPIEDYLQTDASQPRGLAGGPVLDAQGKVVGMNTGWVFGSQVFLGHQSGIGYAVPAEWVGRALDWIHGGRSPRAWIGAFTVPSDPENRAQYRLPPQVRLVVAQVFPRSPAAVAGLKRGDGLLKIRGQEVVSLPRVQEDLLGTKPGESVTVELSRAGESQSFPVTLGARPDRPRLSGVDALHFFAGLEIAPDQEGRPVVTAVVPGSVCAAYGIAPGDLLLSLLSKKDWDRGAKDNSRWRSVKSLVDVETRIETAYSDLDFYLGLRLRAKNGDRREIGVWAILTPTAAL